MCSVAYVWFFEVRGFVRVSVVSGGYLFIIGFRLPHDHPPWSPLHRPLVLIGRRCFRLCFSNPSS